MSNTELVRLSEEEAADFAVLDTTVREGHRAFIEVGSALLEIRDRRLYLQEFGSFEEYCRSRCGHGRGYADQIIRATTVVKEIESANSDDSYARNHIPDTVAVAYPLYELPKSERVEAWKTVNERTNGKPTFPDVRAEVDRRKGKSSKPKGKPKGQSRVNGQLVDDPPDIAKDRRRGKIPQGVVPEVTEAGADDQSIADIAEENEEARAKAIDALSDEDWLNGLPLYDRLTGLQRRCFREDALAYRSLEPARKAYAYAVSRVSRPRKEGPWLFSQKLALRKGGPETWIACPSTEEGGCGGSGILPIGQCPKCYGSGYWIPKTR